MIKEAPKKAVIDIGSNSVRLFVCDGIENKKYLEATKLAQGCKDGILDLDSITRTVDAVDFFIKKANSLGYPPPSIFATEAVRAAKNLEQFLFSFRKITSIRLDILTGEEEAILSFLGASLALDEIKKQTETLGVIDIGGASVEYTYGLNDSILYKKSLPLGAIALKNTCGDDKTSLKEYIKAGLEGFPSHLFPKNLLGVGGTLTSLAAMDLRLKEYDPLRVHGHTLYKESLLQLEDEIFSYPLLTERFKTLMPSRANIIKQGITLILSILERIGVDQITVSEYDNLEGYLIYKKI